jgi:hypothetical protein
MKTIEEVREFIKTRQAYYQKEKYEDGFQLEESVGKVKFGYELLHFIESGDK